MTAIDQLRTIVAEYDALSEELATATDTAETELALKDAEINSKVAELATKDEEIATLQARIAELEAQIPSEEPPAEEPHASFMGQLVLRKVDGTEIAVLEQDANYDVGGLSVTVTAEPDPAFSPQPTSVKFYLDGVFMRSEASKPWALYGDTSGVFNAGSLASGNHVLKAEWYTNTLLAVTELAFVVTQAPAEEPPAEDPPADNPPPPPPPPGENATVTNSAELSAALSSAVGGEVITLASGAYDKLSLSGKQYSAPVTIKAATQHGAILAGVLVSRCKNVYLDGVKSTAQVRFDSGSNEIDVRNCLVQGGGVYLRDVSFIKVEDNDISGGGIAFVMNHVHDFVVRGNYIHHADTDLGRCAGTCYNGLIENNTLFDVAPASGDHPDGWQMLGVNGITPRDITIRGNFLFDDPATNRGGGLSYGMQGIFLDDGEYTGIVIEENLLLNGHPNGIFLSNGKAGCFIRNNSMRSWKADGGGAQIRLIGNSSGTECYNNICASVGFVNPTAEVNQAVVAHDNIEHRNVDEDLFLNNSPWPSTWEGLLPKPGSVIDIGTQYGAQARLQELAEEN